MKGSACRKANRASGARHRHTAEATGAKPAGAISLALLSLIVVGATIFAHWPVLSVQAVSFDDDEAITQNYLVQHPSWNSVGRFFREVFLSSVVRGYYRPLTLTSLMLDSAMGGRPDYYRPFHRTSLAFHVGTTILVILLCYQIFGQPWVAAMVGLLFGVHPLTVEPIAWVMERKTLLAAFFALATLSAYLRFVHCSRWRWYAAALVLYLLALLSKPTGTPLPIMMLLIGYWPLRRLNRRALLEIIPFFALGAVFAVLTVVCENRVQTMFLPAKLSPLHLPLRFCYLIAFYFSKVLLPVHLSSTYTLPAPLSLWNPIVALAVAGAAVLIAALAISRRWTPALWVGALIFLVGLAPTMGFVGYSWVVASDKYVYFPAVGVLLILGWMLERLWRQTGTEAGPRGRRAATVVLILLAAALLANGTRRYLARWQTTEELFAYMLNLAPDSARLQAVRGTDFSSQGDYARAIAHLTKAIELDPGYAPAYVNRASAYGKMGDYDQAIQDCTKAIELDPRCVAAYMNRTAAYCFLGEYDKAWNDVRKSRQLGGEPAPGIVRRLIQATGRSE